MIHELRRYTLRPGTVAEYLKQSVEVGREIRGDRYGKLEGYWATEVGLLNRLYHLWNFASFEERARLRRDLERNEAWQRYLPSIRPMMLAQENMILAAAGPVSPPTGRPHVYELAVSRCHVGKAEEWLARFREALPARERYSPNVGVWSTVLGQLNQVVELWAYPDLDARADVQRRAAQDPAWKTFLAASASLLVRQESVVLVPAPHSPMQ
jgi:hypothetical protein